MFDQKFDYAWLIRTRCEWINRAEKLAWHVMKQMKQMKQMSILYAYIKSLVNVTQMY